MLNYRRASGTRTQSPEKPRDYVSTARPIPAAGKPSRPEERPTPGREPRPEDATSVPGKPGRPDEKPKVPEKPEYRPAAGKPSRPEEKPRKPEEKPKRGDQTPDSLDEDDVQPGKIPDILSKIPLKEQCICELCTCG